MASAPRPLAPLWQALDGELATLVRPLARQIAALVLGAGGAGGGIPQWRLPSLMQRIADLLAGIFGRAPADQFDPDTGQPLTPAARLVAAGTRTAVQLAAQPVVQEATTLLADQPALLRVITNPPVPTSAAPQLLVDPTRAWVDPNGYRLADRLWQAGEDMRARLDALLEYHVNLGTPANVVANEAAQFLTVVGRGGVEPGGAKGLYAARRLVQTETSRAYGSAVLELARSSPFIAAVGWRLGAGHRSTDPCDSYATRDDFGLGAGNYPPGHVPRFPDHPNCLCRLESVAQTSEDGVRAKLQAWAGGTADAWPLAVAALTDAVTGIPALGGSA